MFDFNSNHKDEIDTETNELQSNSINLLNIGHGKPYVSGLKVDTKFDKM